VEFALILPLFLALILGIIEFGMLLMTYSQTSNQLRAALRYGVILGQSEADPQYLDCDQMESIAQEVFLPSSRTVTIEYIKQDGSGTITCTGTGSVADSQIESGDLLHIQVDSTVDTVTPLISAVYPSLAFSLEGQRMIIKKVYP
jgi:Flp pilus assembly protein TadG